jgi:hypothetical protein
MNFDPELKAQIEQYLNLIGNGVKLKRFLGGGTDGDVWATNRDTAIKAFKREQGYVNERDSYQRLAEYGVTQEICGFWIPKMIAWNDQCMIVEMDFMQNPPYVIDFAKVRLNFPPEFSDEVLEDDEVNGQERFGDNWQKVKCLLAAFESFQIYYLDPSPSNIVFPKSSSAPL